MVRTGFDVTKKIVALLLAGANFCSLPVFGASHNISAANIAVVQNDSGNTTNSVTVTTAISINQLSIREGSNRGDYNVQLGSEFIDDVKMYPQRFYRIQ